MKKSSYIVVNPEAGVKENYVERKCANGVLMLAKLGSSMPEARCLIVAHFVDGRLVGVKETKKELRGVLEQI